MEADRIALVLSDQVSCFAAEGRRRSTKVLGGSVGEQPDVREARLLPEFAPLYPGLEPGTWQDAAALAEQMLTEHLLRPSPGYMLSDRVLAKEHFEFRGGNTRSRPRIARTRRTDPTI